MAKVNVRHIVKKWIYISDKQENKRISFIP